MRFLLRSRFVLMAASISLFLALPAPGRVWAQLPPLQHYGSVEYLTGGFGLDESTALKEAMGQYPLAFTFASSADGRAAYVSGVRVVVRDRYDATVLNVASEGPYLLARLPAGQYQVFATYRHKTLSRHITLSSSGTTRVVFDWPREASPPIEPAPDAGVRRFVPGSIPGLD